MTPILDLSSLLSPPLGGLVRSDWLTDAVGSSRFQSLPLSPPVLMNVFLLCIILVSAIKPNKITVEKVQRNLKEHLPGRVICLTLIVTTVITSLCLRRLDLICGDGDHS